MNPHRPDLTQRPHRRKNILTGEWVLVSPHRTQRPWQGEITSPVESARPAYDPDCYLCPGNKRAIGEANPPFTGTFSFTNDFPALLAETPQWEVKSAGLLIAKGEGGLCRVVVFSPRHDLTLADMDLDEIVNVIRAWKQEHETLSRKSEIRYVQIFENKGSQMGNSNPHPHCQIWAQQSIPNEPLKELQQFRKYYARRRRSLLGDYLRLELKVMERIVYENRSFVIVVPYWAIWPYETMIVPRRKLANILQLRENEQVDFADAMKAMTVKYDNLFHTSFPYSAGVHQAPTDSRNYPEWHLHMHFLPPLLRSATIRKYMVGYEMLAEPQRDLTPEACARTLKSLSAAQTTPQERG